MPPQTYCVVRHSMLALQSSKRKYKELSQLKEIQRSDPETSNKTNNQATQYMPHQTYRGGITRSLSRRS